MANNNELGRWGEQLVCDKLTAEGYAIVARNWRMNQYEIDLIAVKDGEIAFIEVKTRADDDGGDPLDAITPRKIRHMVASASVYLDTYDKYRSSRFDVCGIIGTPETGYKMEYIADAFQPPLRSYR